MYLFIGTIANESKTQFNDKEKYRLQLFYISSPVSSATLTRTGWDASQQSTTTKLLFYMGIKLPIFLAFLKLPLDMVALLSFLYSSTFSFLSLTENKYMRLTFKSCTREARRKNWFFKLKIQELMFHNITESIVACEISQGKIMFKIFVQLYQTKHSSQLRI